MAFQRAAEAVSRGKHRDRPAVSGVAEKVIIVPCAYSKDCFSNSFTFQRIVDLCQLGCGCIFASYYTDVVSD